MFSARHPARVSASSAPASSRSVMKLLNRDTMMAKRSPLAERSPSMVLLGILLFPRKRRLAFLEKCSRSLAPVVGCRRQAESRGLKAQALVDAAIEPHIHRLHGERHGLGSVGQHLVEPGAAEREQLVLRRDVVHQAHAKRLSGVDGLARNQYLERAPPAHQTRQALRAAVTRNDPELHFQLSEPGVGAGNAYGAAHRQ